MTTSSPHHNIYRNAIVGAQSNPLTKTIELDAFDEEFAAEANEVLKNAAEIARALIGAHQAAVAFVIQKDWRSMRKYFSLSEKYTDWADYTTPAVGFGIHKWLLEQDRVVRMTQAELEAHPEWKAFGTEAGKHPPMRGWLAAPLLDRNGANWGLFQLSDKYEGDFTEEDEQMFLQLVELVSLALEALWEVRNLKKERAAGK
ncbi:MAG: GAF domain-containing protein [Chloroflexota bacterium]|jgi:GAF domain-containing protein|nr:GAF domain-containing protein [Anaerolineae bacterium]HMM29780.1 GAF domain-containing protein [Aggregatilineaceae bacterium]